ncbi:hypothetical protein BFP70_07975 [Thioclava sp. SK-1]|uniref:transglutaminase family protein n=1 Tax=Thioclava sp. SK-1 TaxID=1889770 RepID=UPI000824D34F|nr:transglutaminase family protein [Thioclava sp. SK-1]OCX66044.1 hypothetical protein BFP70_07975 [Thioclava sp. SK-1]
MQFSIRHVTEYSYSAPVKLGAHRLRLSPRPDGAKVEDHQIHISPPPVSRRRGSDLYGNAVLDLEFAGSTKHLKIETVILARTVTQAAQKAALTSLPLSPPPNMSFCMVGDVLAPVARLSDQIAEEAEGDPLLYLELLCDRLHGVTGVADQDNLARLPDPVLVQAQAVVPKLTSLFVACSRAQGIPARYVSGYTGLDKAVDGKWHLSIWAEVHLPGLGWIGYDPSFGVVVNDAHIALCAAPDQLGTLPLEGAYWGAGVQSQLEYAVEIETAE